MDVVLKELLRFIAQHMGKDLVLVLKDAIRGQYRRLFVNRNVLILGARQTGKTTLLLYLQHGTPYEKTREGEQRTADPTAAVAIVDRRVEVDKGTFLRLKKDVPGDLALRDTWQATLQEVRPDGIVYMIDGRLDDAALAAAVDECFRDALGLYEGGLRELAALHMFVGFCDQWSSSEPQRRAKVAQVRALFEARRERVPALETLRFDVAATQLNPHRREWPEVNRALKRFGVDLGG